MKKKMIATLMAMSMSMMALAGCSSESNLKTNDTDASAQDVSVSTIEDTQSAGADTADAQYTIGISQFAEHGSLDNCRDGFLKGLADAGFVEGENLTVEYQNAQTDTGMAATIADGFVSENVSLVCAIATPSAMSAYNSCKDTSIPVIYTAVSDPVGAGLAGADGKSVGNITGTSDALAVTQQLQMIRDLMPDAHKIGIIYTTSEANSVSTIEEYKAHASEYGFEIVEKGISTISDVDMAAASLVEEVDCINNLTDNTVVSALQTVIARAKDAGIPVFGSEIEQVKSGCVAAMGLDYYQLGMQTGAMAAKVLKGETMATDLAFEIIDEPSLYINTAAADVISMDISDTELAKAAETFDSITTD